MAGPMGWPYSLVLSVPEVWALMEQGYENGWTKRRSGTGGVRHGARTPLSFERRDARLCG